MQIIIKDVKSGLSGWAPNPNDQCLYKREAEEDQTDSGENSKTRDPVVLWPQKDLEPPEAKRGEEWNFARFSQVGPLNLPDFWPLEP